MSQNNYFIGQILLATAEPQGSRSTTPGGNFRALCTGEKGMLIFTHSVFYDSSPPTLTDITPNDGALLKGEINQVTVNLADKNGSGIDFGLTTISVADTEGNSVRGQISHDGRSKIIFKIDDLAPSGSYLVRVEVADRAGNQAIFESGFTNLSNLLVASSTTPVTRPIEKAFSRKQLDSVTVQLPKDVGAHLSTLHLVDSSGQVVMGYQDRNSLSDLQYQLQKPLKDDGSDNGTYTIVFTPIISFTPLRLIVR